VIMSYRYQALIGLILVAFLAAAGAARAQERKIFTGKISEIARATQLDLGKKEKFYVVRLAEHPRTEFRLTSEAAVRYGIIKAAGLSDVVTPKMSKGLGWRVKLSCDPYPTGPLEQPSYKVRSLKRLGD
jgi:hypothetical protein